LNGHFYSVGEILRVLLLKPVEEMRTENGRTKERNIELRER
jgi:hypothetical protein